MKWEGHKIKPLADKKQLSLQAIANAIGVSRQTINDWIKGQVPKGNHLLQLCKLLETNPNFFFVDDSATYLSVPMQRRRMNSKVSTRSQSAAKELSLKYLNLYKNYKTSSLMPVIRISETNEESAKSIAKELRSISGISPDKPINYEHTFLLLKKLGVHVIFTNFPSTIKSYAFYTKINDNRVVFVNTETNILDLIFPLLHESVHAIRDEEQTDEVYDEVEEDFCDLVANYIQFPSSYVEMAYEAINGLENPAQQINTLKSLAKTNGHSLYGIVKAINAKYENFNLEVGGADSNLRKEFPTIGNILFEKDDPRKFLKMLNKLSPLFMTVIEQQLESITNRKLAELLNLDSELDAKQIRFELSFEIAYEAA